MRRTTLILLVLLVLLPIIACDTGESATESEKVAALEATIAALESRGQEEQETPLTQTPYPSPTPEETQSGVLWAIHTMGNSYVMSQDRVFDIGGAGLVVGYDLQTGEQLWQWEEQWETYGKLLLADQDAVYLARSDGRYYALDANTGEERWKVTVHPEYGAAEGAIQDTERLYLRVVRGAGFGDFHVAIDKSDGRLAWELSELALIGVTDRTLLVRQLGVGRGDLAGLDPATGQVIWQISSEECDLASVLLLDQEMFCHGQSAFDTKPVSAFQPDSSSKMWQTQAENLCSIQDLTPCCLYVSSCGWDESTVRVFNRQTGEERWDTEVAGFLGEVDGVAVVSQSALGFTWALDALTGNVLWRNDDLLLSGIAGVSQGILIGWGPAAPGSYGYFVFGIDFDSGERKWRLEGLRAGQLTSPDGKGRPFHVFGDNLIYRTDDTLVVLDPQTGETVSTIPLPGSIFDFQPRRDNVLFTGTFDLCEVHLPLAAPEPTPTPPPPTPNPATSSDYYPMAVANYWVWRTTQPDGSVSQSSEEVVETQQMEQRTVFLVREDFDGGIYFERYLEVETDRVAWHREDTRDEDGMLLNTVQPRDSAATLWEMPLEIGQRRHYEWALDAIDSDGTTQLARIDRDYVVEAMESVNVPAGYFEGCYRVRTTLSSPGSTGNSRSQNNWLCPGVGLVKIVVLADASDEETIGRTVELMQYRVQ